MRMKAALALALVMSLCGHAYAGKKVGFLMWVTDQKRFVEAKNGMLKELTRAGYKEPDTVFIVEDVGADKAKLGPAIDRLLSQKVDLLVPIGTNAAIAAVGKVKTTPIVYTFVYDPVEAKIIKSWENSGNNATGTAAYLSMDDLLKRLTADFKVKKLLVVYTPGERQTEMALKALQTAGAERVAVVPFALKGKEDLAGLPAALKEVNGVYITPGAKTAESVEAIVAESVKAKVLSVSGTEDFAAKGVVWSLSIDPFVMGSLAGKKAAAVLGGASPSSIPSDYPKVHNLEINMKTARAAGIMIPENVRTAASQVLN